MAYTITDRCIRCHNCLPQCPRNAIYVDGDTYQIDLELCNSCRNDYEEPQCVVLCPVNSPVPHQARKGRYKNDQRQIASPTLFPNGKTNPFASAMVIWELCNILAQRSSVNWQTDPTGNLFYQRQVSQGRSNLSFRPTEISDLHETAPGFLSAALARPVLESLDIRAACLHLIYAAHATGVERPWEDGFVINDQQIEDYLGLDKRKDLSKPVKLALIKDLVQQPCKFRVTIDWATQGQIQGFSLADDYVWHLADTEHHFQEDDSGCKHLVGMTFHIQAGEWAKYFLNKQGYWQRSAFYQYGNLPKSLLTAVMSSWQQHEGATRMMLWLLFKTRMGEEQRITVPTLMRIAYGEERVTQSMQNRGTHHRLMRMFESDLEVLNHYGLRPVFDPDTYPEEIQPLWAKLAAVPEDAEAALEFWMNDGQNGRRLTDPAPKGKWQRLMNARISRFNLPPDWEPRPTQVAAKKQSRSHGRSMAVKPPKNPPLSSSQIVAGRQRLQMSQRVLAQQIGKSQSWIRDVENGRFQPTERDQVLLRKVLGIG